MSPKVIEKVCSEGHLNWFLEELDILIRCGFCAEVLREAK